MDLISVAIFIATIALIVAMFFLDLSKYKFHFFFAIVALGVVLYSYGMSFNGETLNAIDTVLKAFGNTTAILRGIFRTTDISDRINNDLLFLLSAYAIHVIGFGYTYILIFAIFFQNLGLKMRFYHHRNKPHVLVLGDDEKLKYFLSSYDKNPHLGGGQLSLKRYRLNLAIPKRYLNTKELNLKYRFKPGVTTFDPLNQSLTSLLGSQKKGVVISLLTQSEEILALVEQFNEYFQQYPTSSLNVYILYENQDQLPVFESFSQEKHKVRFFSYHQLVAQQLMLEHPLTKFIPIHYIDQERVTLKEVDIKYHLLGHGQTLQAIYQHLYVTNQFPPTVSSFFGKVVSTLQTPPIQYLLYQDPAKTDNVEPFTYEHPSPKDYLPNPPLSSSTKTIQTSYIQDQFINAVNKQITTKDDFNIIVIAFQHDMTNLQVLEKVIRIFVEKRISLFRIFVQILNPEYVQASKLFKHDQIIPFGYGESGYAMQQITNPVFNQIAAQIQNTLNPNTSFDTLSSQEKESLLYEAISVRFKLNLMGLDLAIQSKGLTKENYFKRYDPSDDARFVQTHPRAKNDADLNRYKPVLKKKRNLLARQEHLRWTAFQSLRGMIPMSLTEMKTHQHYRDLALKKDARMTSFEGLFELHDFLIHNLNYEFSKADLIYPTFHTMDHVYDILKDTPYRIIDKLDTSKNQTIELEKPLEDALHSDIKHS